MPIFKTGEPVKNYRASPWKITTLLYYCLRFHYIWPSASILLLEALWALHGPYNIRENWKKSSRNISSDILYLYFWFKLSLLYPAIVFPNFWKCFYFQTLLLFFKLFGFFYSKFKLKTICRINFLKYKITKTPNPSASSQSSFLTMLKIMILLDKLTHLTNT